MSNSGWCQHWECLQRPFSQAWFGFHMWVNHSVMPGTYGSWTNLPGGMIAAETNWVNKLWGCLGADAIDFLWLLPSTGWLRVSLVSSGIRGRVRQWQGASWTLMMLTHSYVIRQHAWSSAAVLHCIYQWLLVNELFFWVSAGCVPLFCPAIVATASC